MSNQYQCRPFDEEELLRQIGLGNVFAISGGRVGVIKNNDGETVEIVLKAGKGYQVCITLSGWDTWTVRREFVRSGVAKVKGVQEDVYADQVGEVAWQASLFGSSPYWGQGKKVTN